MTIVRLIAVASLFAGLFGAATHLRAADDAIVLRYASPYSPGNPFSIADRAWMQVIEEKSAGRIRFETFWNGALVGRRHTVQELAAGVADIGVISPILSRAGMALIQGQLTFYDGVPDRETAEYAFWDLWKTFPEIRAELKGLKVITINSGSPMFILTTHHAVRTLEDLRGLRLKTTADKVRPLKTLGVDAVPMPMGEAYVALHRGILDGAVAPADTLILVHFDEVMRYLTMLPTLRPPYPSRAMNERAWNKLPKDLQVLIEESASWWSDRIYAETQKVEARSLGYAAEVGLEVIEPPKEDVEQFVAALVKEGQDVASELTLRGLPGMEMYARVRRVIAETVKTRPTAETLRGVE